MTDHRQRRRSGIYVIPTAFTIGNMFCGFASLIHASQGNHELAAMLIIVAAVLDGLDGRIARLTGTTSEFGLQFDSLADTLSFGVAPAICAYQWGMVPAGRVGWTLAFLYVVCAATRLARYNIRGVSGDKRYFAGLPSPMAGSCIASIIFAFPEPPRSVPLAVTLALLMVGIALLMVSRLRYRSFREIDLRNRWSYLYVLPLAGVLAAIALQPNVVLLALLTGYVISGPVAHLPAFRRPEGAAENRKPTKSAEVVDGPAAR